MSLNGLDATEVNEAYQSALVEGGGWYATKFSPHDAIFSFVTPKGLNDVALSSACSLHTAAASIKSSSDSLRQRGLSEIVEDVSEQQAPEPDVEIVTQEEDPADWLSLHARPARTDSFSNAHNTGTALTQDHRSAHSPSERGGYTEKALPPTPNEGLEEKATTRNALEDTFLETRPSIEGRPSFQSTRQSIRNMRTSFDYRPKMKLGPRPSLESSGRGHTSDRAMDIRPVSTLPSGVRLPAKRPVLMRPKSANGRTPVVDTTENPIPPPMPAFQGAIPEENPGPSLSAVQKQLQSPEKKASAITPEKRRLRKALEIRQKQLAAMKAQQVFGKEEAPRRHLAEPSSDDRKRESLTATLPDVSPSDYGTTDVLQERIDALNQDPDIVHVGPQNLGKGVQDNFEVSPISIPDTSDGPSTQASSISDEDETPTKTEPLLERQVHVDPGSPIAITGQPKENETLPPVTATASEQSQETYLETASPHEPIGKLPAGQSSSKEQRSGDDQLIDPIHAPNDQSSSTERRSSIQEASRSPSSSGASTPLPRSGASQSPNKVLDIPKPHEIPLPPVDEAEERNLIPHKQVFIERSTLSPLVNNKESQHQDTKQFRDGKEGSRETRPSTAETINEQRERRTRRHGLISPIKRVSSPDYSDEQFLSDDSFMEELKSATVQEAKPISVSKSPIMPIFPRSVSESKSSEQLRPASAGSRLNRRKRLDDQPMMPKLPDLYSARSASASYTPLFEAQLSPPTLKKVGVSSGISQRIKALEQLSSRPTSPASQLSSLSAALGSSSASTDKRKTSFRASQAAANIAKASTQSSYSIPSMPFSPMPRPADRDPEKAGDSVVRIDVATKPGKARPESISVTARIVRSSKNKVPEIAHDPSQAREVDLYPSPLIVEHQSMRPTSPPSPLRPPKPPYARSTSSASSTLKSDPPPGPRRDSFSSRLSSTPSRRGSEPELPRSMSESSINSAMNFDASKEEKKESRKSRLFKRMSNISAASRRSIASALSPVRKDIKEEPIVEHHEPSRETIRPLAVEIGDVNIQFPDTLLWKRRYMKIDEQGLLVLSASKVDNHSKVIPKRYPFTEFHPPYVPDQDQQELPNNYKTPTTSGVSEEEVRRAAQYCTDLLMQYDHPSYILSTFLPPSLRPAHLAIRAFNLELARIPDTSSSAPVRSMRYQFWRDTITSAFDLRPAAQPVAVLLSSVLTSLRQQQAKRGSIKPTLNRSWFLRLISTREKHSANAPYPTLTHLETYAENTYSTLLYLTLSALSLHSLTADHIASHIGKASGITAILRGVPLLAFPPPPNHHSNTAGMGGSLGTKRTQQGAVTLPLDVMAECGVKEEDVLRYGAEAPGLKDAVFKVATRASDHLITARGMVKSVQGGGDVGHAFEYEGQEGHEYEYGDSPDMPYSGEGGRDGRMDKSAQQREEVEKAFGVFMPAVSTRLWLERLEKADFDIFDERLRRRDWRLPWKAWWAHRRRMF
ncbi:MAG: hypothetical protein Q9210_004733 [Variospora velana]